MNIFDKLNENMAQVFKGDKEEKKRTPEEIAKSNYWDFHDHINVVYGEDAFCILNESGSLEELFDTGSATVKIAGRFFELSLYAKEVPHG